MKRRINKGKKWWLGLSVEELDSLIISNNRVIDQDRRKIALINNCLPKAIELYGIYHKMIGEIRRIEKERINGIGNIVGSLFGNQQRENAKMIVERNKKEAEGIYQEILRLGGDPNSLHREIEICNIHINRLTDYNNAIADRISTLKRKLERFRHKKIKENKVKALAASYTGRSRIAAESVKRQMGRYEYCPYCFEKLGDDPEADHIIPVSYGGLSIEENMVYICVSCNRKKMDHTLREFCIKYHLDRSRIERILSDMGKKF